MIRLRPLGPDLARRIAQGEPHDEIKPEALSEIVRIVSAAHHRLYEQTGACPPWIAYLAREDARGTAAFVGVCSFKSGPRIERLRSPTSPFPSTRGVVLARRWQPRSSRLLGVSPAGASWWPTPSRRRTLPLASWNAWVSREPGPLRIRRMAPCGGGGWRGTLLT